MPNTVLGDASRLIPDPIGIRCFNTLASLLDLGSGCVMFTLVNAGE